MGSNQDGSSATDGSESWQWDCYVASVSRCVSRLEAPAPSEQESDVLRLREAATARTAREAEEEQAGAKKGAKKKDKKADKKGKKGKGAPADDEPDEEELQMLAEARALATPVRQDLLPRWKGWA